MKLNILPYCILVLLTISINRLQAQSNTQSSVTGHVSAEVVSAFSAAETSQMNFGRFSPGPDGGEIILTPQGTISVLGSVARSGGLHNAASFFLSGDIYTTFSVTLPTSITVLTNTKDAKTMQIKNWISVPSPSPAAGKLDNGVQTVYVGATLEVGTLNDNPVGIYTGSYAITFDFN